MNERYSLFDGLRTIGAIGILLMHYLANIDFTIKSELIDSGILYSKIIPNLTLFVYLFFVISAFSMCCGYCRKFDVDSGKSNFDTESFYSKRYARIWPFFAMLVAIDFVMNPTLEELYQCFADLTLAFNFLPNPHIDAIGVGWFLGVVFLFYMIFPWFVYLLQKKSRAWFAMIVAILFHIILVKYFLTSEFCTEYQISSPRHNIVYSFPFFMVGGLLYLYREKLGKSKYAYIYMLCGIVLSIAQILYTPEIIGENILFVLLLFVFWVLYAMSGGIQIKGFKFLDNRIMNFMSNISLEIYLCHMVMFRVIEKSYLDSIIDNSHLYYWATCVIGILFSICFSWIVKYKVFWWLGKRIPQLAWISPQ